MKKEEFEIRESEGGVFQVWRGSEILRPDRLTFHSEGQSQHNFMFFTSLKSARKAIKNVIAKCKVIKVHTA